MDQIDFSATDPKVLREICNACWKFKEAELYKVCPQLHAECHREFGLFLLLTNDAAQYEIPLESLVDYLAYAHGRFGIKLDRVEWMKQVLECLDDGQE